MVNSYLHPLDLELEKRGLSVVRYADDIAIFCASARAAARVAENVIAWIDRVKLPVHRQKRPRLDADSTSLLGFRLETDGTIRLAPQSVERLKTKVREL